MKKTCILLFILCIALFTSCNNKEDKNIVLDFSTTYYGSVDYDDLNLKHGELLSVIQNDKIVVVKGKISPNFNNDLTIKQNYISVADLIKNHGFNTCDELKYWAIADLTNGMEAKVISFTLDENTINDIYNGNIVDTQLGDYVKDLWILPSLKD